jgi:hypothetical protein
MSDQRKWFKSREIGVENKEGTGGSGRSSRVKDSNRMGNRRW